MIGSAPVERAFVRVSGPDAVAYLQGQLSQDLEAVPVGGAAPTFVLHPTGKLVAVARLQRVADDEVVLDTDAPAGEALAARLSRFLLRTKATVELLDGWRCVRVFGDAPAGALPAVWPAPGPADIVGPDVDMDVTLSAAEHDRLRIEAGVPVSGIDVDDDTIPGEAGGWLITAAASFTKGCYTGQELVARIDSRGGNVPRPLRLLRVHGLVPPPGADADGAGVLTSVAPDAGGAVALARLGRRVEPGAEIVVRWDGGEAEATVEVVPGDA